MRSAFHRLTTLLLFTVIVPVAVVAQQASSIAFQRAQGLQRGINTSMWFSQSADYSVHHLESYTTPADIALIEQMGFDHCRLSIDGGQLMNWLHAGRQTPFMTQLDAVVNDMLRHHLSVIIDIHPTSAFKARLFHGEQGVANFTALWRALAAHYASYDPNHVFFEIMNEPEQSDPYRWQGIEATVADAIRQVAPRQTIIACGAHWSGLGDLLVLEPLADPNVIYTFHDYEPFAFTHQGATWASADVLPERGIPYPSSPKAVSSDLQQEPTLAGKFFLDQYGQDRWNAARVDDYISYAAQWSALHHVPVYCGEFGVFRDYAPPAMRAQWLHDMRVALEKYHIGWAMWDYQANFGVVTKMNNRTIPDPEVVRALGLRMPSNP